MGRERASPPLPFPLRSVDTRATGPAAAASFGRRSATTFLVWPGLVITTSIDALSGPVVPRYDASEKRGIEGNRRRIGRRGPPDSGDLEGWKKYAESIGARVKASRSDTRTATDTVIPKSRRNFPTVPPTNPIGRKTATIVVLT